MVQRNAAVRNVVLPALAFLVSFLLVSWLCTLMWPALNSRVLALITGAAVAIEVARHVLTHGEGRSLYVPALTGAGYAALLVTATVLQAGRPAPDASRLVKGGGILVSGWSGRVDAESAHAGQSIDNSRFELQGSTLKLAIGPAAVYWNPANAGNGNYTAKATFHEPDSWPADGVGHPHPFGVFIGGTNLDTSAPSLLYCAAYGDGKVLIRGFSKGKLFTPMQVTMIPAVHRAEPGGGVTQEIGWTVKDDRAECSINGTVVAGYDKSELVGPDALESFDGVAGIRVAADLDVEVTEFAVTKN